MNEALETAISNKLTGGTALTALLAGTASVYNQVAPPGAFLDFVVFDVTELELNDTPQRATDYTVTVQAVSETSKRKAGSIDAAVDALLHDGELSVSGWSNYWQKRTRGFAYAEITPASRAVWHVGGEYLVRLEKL